jgi:hypothetical protein
MPPPAQPTLLPMISTSLVRPPSVFALTHHTILVYGDGDAQLSKPNFTTITLESKFFAHP